jgi:5-methylcytosine-specific restriction endonuclease McrA
MPIRVPVKEETRWGVCGGPVPSRVKAYVFARDGYTCRYCGASGEGVILEPDHVIPNRLYGPDVAWNLVAACKPCNRDKSGHALDCWQAGKPCRRGPYGTLLCR